MACADAGAGDLETREFSEWSKVKFAQHWGPCQTLRNVDGDQRCDVRICGVWQEPLFLASTVSAMHRNAHI